MFQYKNKQKSNSRISSESGAGFTLIETLVYIVLFAIVIGGGMTATYQIIQATDANYNHVILQDEANFLFRKIDWALIGIIGITTPPNTIPTNNLVVNKTVNNTPATLTFETHDSDSTCPINYLCLKQSSAVPLNSSSLAFSNPLFTRTIVSGKPDSITASFTLTTAQNGRPATQNFSITKYLRK